MRGERTLILIPVLALCFVTLAAVLVLGSHPAHAFDTTRRCVAPTGTDAGTCSNPLAPCQTVQYAVDQATAGDEILIATGLYTGVQARAGITQMVYISKTLSLSGGYTPSFEDPPDGEANPTTLDAEGKGRVIYATGPGITITIEGLRFMGGDASGLYGEGTFYDTGGGLCVLQATAVVSGCLFQGNTASRVRWGSGGGVHLGYGDLTLIGNEIISNTGATAGPGWGGGVRLWQSTGRLEGNTFRGNVGSRREQGMGGGFDGWYVTVGMEDNTFVGNVANTGEWGRGGGVHMEWCDATLTRNRFRDNWATTTTKGGIGGGLYLYGDYAGGGDFYLYDNTVVSNTASVGDGTGGGIYVEGFTLLLQGNHVEDNAATRGAGIAYTKSPAGLVSELRGNTIISNTAGAWGGGIYLRNIRSLVTLNGNFIRGNTAPDGAGVHTYLENTNWQTTFVNNLFMDNHATGGQGSAVYIDGPSPNVRLAHNTFTGNSAPSGVYVKSGIAQLINTIVHSHTVGVHNAGGTVTMTVTLWEDTITPTLGIVSETGSFEGNTAFQPDGYHLTSESDALEAGQDAGVLDDIDGDPRPMLLYPDIGADEYRRFLIYLPLVTRNKGT